MRIHSKVAVVLLALVVGLPLAYGQDTASSSATGQPPAGTDGQVATPPIRPQMDRYPRSNQGRAWGSDGHRGGMQWRGREHRQFMLARLVSSPTFRERIGITPEQAQKIRTQTLTFRKAQIRDHADLQVKHLELRDLLSANKPDRNAIYEKLQEISAARLTEEKSAIDFRLDMRAALTPGQQQKLQQMRRDFFAR